MLRLRGYIRKICQKKGKAKRLLNLAGASAFRMEFMSMSAFLGLRKPKILQILLGSEAREADDDWTKAIKSCSEVQKRVENFLATGNVHLGAKASRLGLIFPILVI